MKLSIDKATIAKLVGTETCLPVEIQVGGDTVITISFSNDHGSLYYAVFDEADLDGVYTIEGHLPEFFDE